MSQEFIGGAVLGNYAFSDLAALEAAAGLSSENKRDITNTLEFASRTASDPDPKDKSRSWFHDFISAIAKLGWTMQTPGPEDVDLGRTPGTSAIGKLIIKMANGMGIAIEVREGSISIPSRRQLAREPGLFSQCSAGANNSMTTVADVGLQNDVLTMQIVAVKFEYKEDAGPFGQFSSSHTVRAERFYFTASQPFLDAHREEVERKLQQISKDEIKI
ncbi:hypothetical protein BD779DRAFT_210737 [Infundibulicybe gibba]|nr:hypothetical protein BD779DRAFT_210737 [Infundibulicybe gibba]